MKKYIFFTIIFLSSQLSAIQYIYPVADFYHDDAHSIILLFQKSLYQIELWIWDTEQHYATKGLSSFVTPANLRMLPSGNGFSFIDQGFIKIKEFIKRSPTTLQIYEPIGLFTHMNWIDEQTFYFVARQGDFFQIFQGDMNANVQALTYDAADALYPQKIKDQLFYIKRDADNQHTIVVKSWDTKPLQKNMSSEIIQTIIESTSKQLCYLYMLDEQQGFYIQAPTKKVKSLEQEYEFICHHLQKINDVWKSDELYTFLIPAKYIVGKDRLYESIEPFLPNYTKAGFIYFTSWNTEKNEFELFEFNLATRASTIISDQLLYRRDHQIIFKPFIADDVLHCGLILEEQQEDAQVVIRSFEFDEWAYFQTPHCTLKK